jgi:hypothetical protein
MGPNGPTMYRVPDHVVEGEVLAAWREAQIEGRTRPTIMSVLHRLRSQGRGVATLRIDMVIAALEAEGRLPDLPTTCHQRGGNGKRAKADAFRDEYQRRAAAIRWEGQNPPPPPPPPPRPTFAEALRSEHFKREKALGLKGRRS